MHTYVSKNARDTIFLDFRKTSLDLKDKTEIHWQLVTQDSWAQTVLQNGSISTRKKRSGAPRSLVHLLQTLSQSPFLSMTWERQAYLKCL